MRNPKAYIWAFIGKIGPQLIYLVATMVLARFLTPDDFGKIGVLAIFISIANTLNDAGLGGSLIKEKNISTIDCSTINIFNITVSALLYIILFLVSPAIERFFAVEGLCTIARILGLVFLVNSASLVPRAIMIRELRFKMITLITFISIIIASAIAIAGAILGAGVYALVSYQLSVSLVATIGIIWATKYRFSSAFDINSFKKLFSFGFFTTITNVVDNVYENLLSFLFGKFLSINQTGYLAQAKKLEDASISAGKDTINNVAFPVLTRLRENKTEFWDEALTITKSIVLLALPCILFITIFSKEIVKIAFGDSWLPSSTYLSALMLAGFFMLLESAIRNYIKSLGYVGRLLKYTLFKRIICILLILAIAFISPEAIIYAYIAGAFIGLCVNAYLYCKIMTNNMFTLIGIIALNALPSIICTGMMYLFYRWYAMEWVTIVVTSLVAVIYIFIILPKFGFNTLLLLRKIV